jgi:RpiR family transcriptional regulator, carbohydrate utilization regulator
MDSATRDPQAGALIRLRGLYPSLKSALQKVANIILRQPEMAIYASVNEVAAAAGVSEATVMRFCRTLGFKGFQDFKIALAREMVTPSQFPQEEVRSEDDPGTILRKVFQASIAGLQDTLEVLNPNLVGQAAQALLQARRILVCGVGDSAPVVNYAGDRFFLMGLNARGYNDAYHLLTAAAVSGPQDVLLAISHLGNSREVVEAAQLAKEAGARIIAITDNSLSPLSRVADLTLVTASREAHLKKEGLLSSLCQAALIDCLFTLIVLARPEQARENLAKIDKAIPKAT